MKSKTIDNVRYVTRWVRKAKPSLKSVKPFGIDTEAYTSGQCFMIATSEGDVFHRHEFPSCLFTRKYRHKAFVAYNLKYDEGALLQNLTKKALRALWKNHKVEHHGYVYRIIPQKCLTISRNKSAVTFYDMLNFYGVSLRLAAEKYLGENKLDIEVQAFSHQYVRYHWDEIAAYCVHDAKLVQRLAAYMIEQLESYGVYPKRLYSIAYISYQYFRSKCVYPIVKKYWDKHREVLQYAMESYSGGKFEVTEKGVDEYWEYDIVSAYPFEIRNLVDISYARVVVGKEYRKDSVYSFLKVSGTVPLETNNPCAILRGNLCTYPYGEIQRTITKGEYEYLVSNGADLEVLSAIHLLVHNRIYPFRKEIDRLTARKAEIKASGSELEYHTIKILLNSLYGKFCQLVWKTDHWQASACWNPIYASVITGNTRVRMSEYQMLYPSVVAVHTDSIISTRCLPIPERGKLGDMQAETQGKGVILGSGIYQIGDKVAFRGFPVKMDLFSLLDSPASRIRMHKIRPYTWREVAFHNWGVKRINLFDNPEKYMRVNFDSKRIWLNDWQVFSDVPKRKVQSLPFPHIPGLY